MLTLVLSAILGVQVPGSEAKSPDYRMIKELLYLGKKYEVQCNNVELYKLYDNKVKINGFEVVEYKPEFKRLVLRKTDKSKLVVYWIYYSGMDEYLGICGR